MAVKTNITINIVEPGSDVPVPDTGLFTHGIGGTETTIIVSAALVTVLVILSIVLTTYMYRKHKKQGRTTKLVHIIDQTKAVVKSKKRVTIGLSIIALLVSACTFTAFMLNTNKSNTSAIEGNDTEQQSGNTEQTGNTNNLTINTESKELTIEVKDQPVFAVLPVQVTVEEATQAGYTLTAYTDNTDLVSTTNPNNKIPMVTVEGDELTTLEDNTWGLALDNEPTSKDNKVYKALSTDQDNPTIIKTIDDYSETEANDTTTIYYGFYITPDIPYGTYTGGEVEYEATQNRTDLATVIFDGNGLYFNGDEARTNNVVMYDTSAITPYTERYSYTPNLNGEGEVLDDSYPNSMYPVDSGETFVYEFPGADKIKVNIVKTDNDGCPKDENDYFTFWAGNYPNYTAKSYETTNPVLAFGNTTGKYVFEDYNNVQTYVDGDTITFAYTTGPAGGSRGCHSGYGYYVILTGYNAEGNLIGIIGNEAIFGEYALPESGEPYRFLGWNTDKNAVVPIYYNEQEIATDLNIEPGSKITLYAIWQRSVEITYNGNGADDKTNMDDAKQYGYAVNLASANLRVDLLPSNYQRGGYGFVGWSTDPDAWDKLTDNDDTNNPTIYGPNQTITIDEGLIAKAGENRKLIMYAIWAPAEKDSQENPVYLQNWTGCSSLDKTVYNSVTNTLTVGKNTITALTDNRDNNVYTIARLADGNCWMTENLRLDNSVAITNINTNNPYTVNGNAVIKNDDGNSSGHLSSNNNSWCRYGYNDNVQIKRECTNQSYLNMNNTTSAVATLAFEQDFTIYAHSYDLDENIYSYGNYYNWYSAMAGRGDYDGDEENIDYDYENPASQGNSVYGPSLNGEVKGSICPIGWELPRGRLGSDTSFPNLDKIMGGTGSYIGSSGDKWRSFPNNYVYNGSWNGSSAQRGYNGNYWSSSVYRYSGPGENNGVRVYHLSVMPGNSAHADVSSYEDKQNGYSVRCVMPVQ